MDRHPLDAHKRRFLAKLTIEELRENGIICDVEGQALCLDGPAGLSIPSPVLRRVMDLKVEIRAYLLEHWEETRAKQASEAVVRALRVAEGAAWLGHARAMGAVFELIPDGVRAPSYFAPSLLELADWNAIRLALCEERRVEAWPPLTDGEPVAYVGEEVELPKVKLPPFGREDEMAKKKKPKKGPRY